LPGERKASEREETLAGAKTLIEWRTGKLMRLTPTLLAHASNRRAAIACEIAMIKSLPFGLPGLRSGAANRRCWKRFAALKPRPARRAKRSGYL